MTYQCEYCSKSFEEVGSVFMHTKAKHHDMPNKWHAVACTKNANRHKHRPQPSIADRMIEAQLQYAMGGPVDEDYLLDSMDLDC